MTFRTKSNFVSLSIVATVTVLTPLKRQICFTHGFQSALDISSTRTKPTIYTEQGMGTRTKSYPSSILILSSTNNGYGKGADIWPDCNDEPVQLSDSFPNGIVPTAAAAALDQPDQAAMSTEKQSSPKRYIQRILRKAASRKESDRGNGFVDTIPSVVALLLLVTGLARPADAALVACWTAYFTILNMTAQSARASGAPILPATPPQGHSPAILSNPLGMSLERSSLYRRWLKLGVLLGWIGPLVWLLSARGTPLEAARSVGRPLFLLSCQMVTEGIAKQNEVPLPLRVLIPVIYNASRLMYLWQWAFASLPLGGRALGILNALYGAVNLFAFLIPIASVRYMRAHFFGVEAEEVTTRIGLEETIGIVPNNNF